MRKIILVVLAAATLPSFALAAEMASPNAVTTSGGEARDISLIDAKRAVRELLTLADEHGLYVGEATRAGGVIKVMVNNVQGTPVKSFKVDAKTGEVVS